METEGITMTLWSSRKLKNMRNNITYSFLPLTEKEKEDKAYLMENILHRIQNKHWEVELNDRQPFWPLE